MKCPHCNSEISNLSVCPNCGQRTDSAPAAQPNASTSYPSAQQGTQPQAQPYAQPNYQPTAQGASPYYYSAPVYGNAGMYVQPQKEKTGGEIAAIVIAVIVSVLSFFGAMIMFVGTVGSMDYDDYYVGDEISSNFYDDYGQYGIDDFTDEDSLDHFLDYYNSLFGNDSKYPSSSPAQEHTPIEFDDYLHSFSDGNVQSTYSVELDEVYRGDAALKLLEGARLPEIDDGKEVYLAKFKVTIMEQDTEAYVEVAPSIFTAAYKGDELETLSSQYDSLRYLGYKDENQLLKKGESGDRWMAFVVDKTDERPLIMWDKYDGEYFRFSKAATSSQIGLEAGAAIESQSDVSSN